MGGRNEHSHCRCAISKTTEEYHCHYRPKPACKGKCEQHYVENIRLRVVLTLPGSLIVELIWNTCCHIIFNKIHSPSPAQKVRWVLLINSHLHIHHLGNLLICIDTDSVSQIRNTKPN